MTILEFIRRNSLLVLIVIAGVGAGLVMMDYSGKTSAFSRDYYIQVNGIGYDDAEVMNSGENGKEFISSLLWATQQNAIKNFDTDGDGQLNEQEQAAHMAWLNAHPDVLYFYNKLNQYYNLWSYGPAYQDADNVAITRALIHSAADELGLHPSEEQIDEYLRHMPPFCMADGSFNTELYQRLAGFRNGTANRVQEEVFRGVIADMMIWEELQSLVTSDVHFNTKAQLAQIEASEQSVSGRTAWLAAENVPPPAEPTDEELKAYWEQHKEQYKSPERRIISVYTLTPGEESNMENLLFTTDAIMQELTQANGQGLDRIIAETQQNKEYDPFTYKQADGATHATYPLGTKEELTKALTDTINNDGEEMPLAEVAFSAVADAPTVQTYEAATAAGNADKILSIKQIRGFYTSTDNKLKLVRIEAVEKPEVLSFEDAREQALADFKAERTATALSDYAHKLYEDMNTILQEKELGDAFALAIERGATVENYGPADFSSLLLPALPDGVTETHLLGTTSGKLAPLVVLDNGARITSVDRRTVKDSQDISLRNRLETLPRMNESLRQRLMLDWLNAAYSRVKLSQRVRLHGSK